MSDKNAQNFFLSTYRAFSEATTKKTPLNIDEQYKKFVKDEVKVAHSNDKFEKQILEDEAELEENKKELRSKRPQNSVAKGKVAACEACEKLFSGTKGEMRVIPHKTYKVAKTKHEVVAQRKSLMKDNIGRGDVIKELMEKMKVNEKRMGDMLGVMLKFKGFASELKELMNEFKQETSANDTEKEVAIAALRATLNTQAFDIEGLQADMLSHYAALEEIRGDVEDVKVVTQENGGAIREQDIKIEQVAEATSELSENLTSKFEEDLAASHTALKAELAKAAADRASMRAEMDGMRAEMMAELDEMMSQMKIQLRGLLKTKLQDKENEGVRRPLGENNA